jgi:hypothetical protein
MAEIKMRIAKDGKLKIAVNGVKGSACKDLGTVESTKATSEMYDQQVSAENEQTQGGGT